MQKLGEIHLLELLKVPKTCLKYICFHKTSQTLNGLYFPYYKYLFIVQV